MWSATSAGSTTDDLARIEERDERQLQGLRLHRQGRCRALVRERAARDDRRRGGRGRRGRPRGAHGVAHAAGSGNNLQLSLDIRLQQVAEAAFGDRRGALVAIEPATGEVLAFVSQAGLRPEPVRRRHRSRELGALNKSPDKPLLNRPLRGAYPPGSTFKPFMALAALTSGQAHGAADDQRPRLFPVPWPAATASTTTRKGATARSTCTSRSSSRATRTTTSSPATRHRRPARS